MYNIGMQETGAVRQIAENWARQFVWGVKIGEEKAQAILSGKAEPEEAKPVTTGRTTLENLGVLVGEVMTNWGYAMRSNGPIV